MSDKSMSRRRVLTALATGGVASLAGCSRVEYDDRLRVDVPEIRESDGGFEGRLLVHNDRFPDEERETETRNPYGTSYEGVRFLGYDHDRQKVLDVPLGDLGPRETAVDHFDADGFPLVVTADAENWTESSDDYLADRGAYLRGYYGRYESVEGTPARGEAGHVWRRLHPRQLDRSLPPRELFFDDLKCRHRSLRRREGVEPNLSLVPDSDEWVHRKLPDPTIRHRFWITVTGDLDSDAYRPPATVELPFTELPPTIRTSIREGRNPDWMDREEFRTVAGGVVGRTLSSPDDLPPCSADHVVCHDDRGENCREGGGRLDGTLERYAWYETSHEDTRRGVVLSFVEKWAAPDAEPIPSCTDEREEEHEIRVTDGTNRIAGLERGKRIDSPPEEAGRYLDARGDDAYHTASVDRRTFRDLVSALEEFDERRLPDCERRHVECFRNPRNRCGSGHRKLFYRLPDGGETRGLVAIYRWNRLSTSE